MTAGSVSVAESSADLEGKIGDRDKDKRKKAKVKAKGKIKSTRAGVEVDKKRKSLRSSHPPPDGKKERKRKKDDNDDASSKRFKSEDTSKADHSSKVGEGAKVGEDAKVGNKSAPTPTTSAALDNAIKEMMTAKDVACGTAAPSDQSSPHTLASGGVTVTTAEGEKIQLPPHPDNINFLEVSYERICHRYAKHGDRVKLLDVMARNEDLGKRVKEGIMTKLEAGVQLNKEFPSDRVFVAKPGAINPFDKDNSLSVKMVSKHLLEGLITLKFKISDKDFFGVKWTRIPKTDGKGKAIRGAFTDIRQWVFQRCPFGQDDDAEEVDRLGRMRKVFSVTGYYKLLDELLLSLKLLRFTRRYPNVDFLKAKDWSGEVSDKLRWGQVLLSDIYSPVFISEALKFGDERFAVHHEVKAWPVDATLPNKGISHSLMVSKRKPIKDTDPADLVLESSKQDHFNHQTSIFHLDRIIDAVTISAKLNGIDQLSFRPRRMYEVLNLMRSRDLDNAELFHCTSEDESNPEHIQGMRMAKAYEERLNLVKTNIKENQPITEAVYDAVEVEVLGVLAAITNIPPVKTLCDIVELDGEEEEGKKIKRRSAKKTKKRPSKPLLPSSSSSESSSDSNSIVADGSDASNKDSSSDDSDDATDDDDDNDNVVAGGEEGGEGKKQGDSSEDE